MNRAAPSSAGDILRIAPSGGQRPDALVVMLHGVGSSAAAMVSIAQALAPLVPNCAFSVMDGPEPFDLAPTGRQWFSVAGVTDLNRVDRVRKAMPLLTTRIEAEQARLGLSWDRTALIGFSQGAIMSLHLAAGLPVPPALAVALSGRVAPPLDVAVGPRGRVLLSHGTADRTIPFAEMAQSERLQRQAGATVETLVIAGHGHSVHPDQMPVVARALGAALPPLRRELVA